MAEWQIVGNITGPTGATGPTGPPGPTGSAEGFPDPATGNQGDILTIANGEAIWFGIGINDLLPDQTGNSGKVLGTDGTDPEWVAQSGGGGNVVNPVLGVEDYTAAPGDMVFCTVEGITITIPVTANHGDTITIFGYDLTDAFHEHYVKFHSLLSQQIETVTLVQGTRVDTVYVANIDIGAGPVSGWVSTSSQFSP